MANDVKTYCIIEIQVECGTWQDDMKMDQIISQSESESRARITRLFRDAVTPDSELMCKRDYCLNGIAFIGVKSIRTSLTKTF